MALTRSGLMTQIEASTDPTELQSLNLKLQAVDREITILTRNMASVIGVVTQINNIDSPPQALVDCAAALQAEVISYQTQLLAY